MKIRHLFFYLFFIHAALSATDWSMELGPAFYRPHKSVKKTYKGGWIDYQLEASYALDCHTEAWVGVNWISKKHRFKDDYIASGISVPTTGSSESTSEEKKQIWILPISLGAKYFYNITPRLSVYLGAGAVYTYLRLEHCTGYFNDRYSKHGPGAVFKSGIRYDWGKYTFVNVFVDYLFQSFHLSYMQRLASTNTRMINLSGVKAGLTVGVYF